MSDEVELFDCVPQLKGTDGADLGLAAITLRRARFGKKGAGAAYLHMVTEQSGAALSDLALTSGAADGQETIAETDGRESFAGAYSSLVYGDHSLWRYSPLLERTLTLNESTGAPVGIKFSTQSEATLFSVTVAAALAQLPTVVDYNMIVGQQLFQGRSIDDDEEAAGAEGGLGDIATQQFAKELTISTLSLTVIDAKTLEVVTANAYSSPTTAQPDTVPTARCTTDWLLTDAAPHQSAHLRVLLGRKGNEALIALRGDVLGSHWNFLADLAGPEGASFGHTAQHIFVMGVRVVDILGAAEARERRLKSRLQNTGARMSLNISADAVRARSTSLRKSLPPTVPGGSFTGSDTKEASLADEISKARAAMKHVDASEVGRSRGSSIANINNSISSTGQSPPVDPSPAPAAPPAAAAKAGKKDKKKGGKEAEEAAPSPVAARPPVGKDKKKPAADTNAAISTDFEVSDVTIGDKGTASPSPTSPTDGAQQHRIFTTNNVAALAAAADNDSDDDVRISPLTTMYFRGDASSDALGATARSDTLYSRGNSNADMSANARQQANPHRDEETVAVVASGEGISPLTPAEAAPSGDKRRGGSKKAAAPAPAEEADVAEEGGGEAEEEEAAPTAEELERIAAKLKRRRAKVEAAELVVADMEAEVLRRHDAMTTEQSELADERQRLEQYRAALDAQQRQLTVQQNNLAMQHRMSVENAVAAATGAINNSDTATISMRSGGRGDNAKGRRNNNNNHESQPLLAMGGGGHHADADQYVFRVEHEFYDSKDMPPGMLRRMPVTCGFVKHIALSRIVAVAIAVGLAAASGVLVWRMASEDEGFLWPMLVLFAGAALTIGVHSRSVPLFFDLYNCVDQSIHGNSGRADPHAGGYERSPLSLGLMVLTVLASLGSIALLAFTNASLVARIAMAIGGALSALGVGAVLVNLSLATHVLWYRIASTVPRQHGALFTRVAIRASAARYQYAKQLVDVGSRRFSPTVLLLAAGALAGAAFAPYYMFMIGKSHEAYLAGAIGFTCASSILFVLALLMSSWEGATRQVIGNMGVQADRWVRGDYNNESDARLEDYVAAQQLLANNLLSGEYAKWTIDFVPFLAEGRSDAVPADYRTFVVRWPYRALSFLMVLLGIVVIPIAAARVI